MTQPSLNDIALVSPRPGHPVPRTARQHAFVRHHFNRSDLVHLFYAAATMALRFSTTAMPELRQALGQNAALRRELAQRIMAHLNATDLALQDRDALLDALSDLLMTHAVNSPLSET